MECLNCSERDTKIEYLKRYGFAQRKAIRINEEIQWWRSAEEKIKPSYSDAQSGNSGRMVTTIEKIEELTSSLQEQLAQCVALRQSIEHCINKVQNERFCEILQLRYLEGYRFEKIASELTLDCRWIRRLHNRAINILTLENPIKSML